MYQLTIENGDIDYNQVEEIRQCGYHTDDITNGCLTTLHEIRTMKELKHIINIVKKDAIELHVFKLVKMPLDKKVEKQVKQNCKNLFPELK